jgi:hypothetical protein
VSELPLLIAAGIGAGAFGSLLGLGGGVLIVPILTLGFGLPLREAVAASLVCVIVTSSAAASVYLQRDAANLKLGMTLEMFTAASALAGGLVAFALPDRALALMFAALLLYVSVTMVRGRGVETGDGGDAAAEDPDGSPPPRGDDLAAGLSGPGYRVHNLRLGVVGSLFAGLVSALLGVGGGIVKVPLMHLGMGVPLRVATATSNLMIGVTASAGGLVYLLRGGIDPYVAAPTALGVFVGASVAARLADRVELRWLRALFVFVLLFTAAQMGLRGLS